MAKTLRNTYFIFVFGFFFLIATASVSAQEENVISLKSYLSQLEKKYDVKFSFVDEDLNGINITISNNTDLDSILVILEKATKLKIQKLNNRYYTITKSSLVTICAYVLDNFEQNTIPGATVEVINSEIAQVTNLDGSFKLHDVPRTAILKIRYIGYNTKYIPVKEITTQEDCSKILLAQNLEQLDEVVVYQFLTSGLSKQADASISLNTSKLGILPGLIEPDILQSIQALPGIKSIDETVSDINVRGGTNDQNLILWNGIKMYQSGHFFGLISAFNPYLTDKVSVYKSGTPSQYGDGVSSVINLETKNDIEDGVFGGAGINLISGDAYGQLPINKNLAFQFSARRSITDFLNTPTYSSFTKRAFQDSEVQNLQNETINENIDSNVTFLFYDFTAKLLYNINENQKLRLNFIGIDNDLSFVETNLDVSTTTQSLLDQTNLSAGIQLESKWNDTFSSHLNVYFSHYNLDAQNISANAQQQLFQKNTVEERALKLKTSYTVSNTFKWVNGYQYIETGITNTTTVTQPPFNSDIKGVIRIHAPYTEVNYNGIENKFIASLGVRGNYILNLAQFGASFNEFLIEPRLNLNFRVAKNIRAQVLGEYKSQTTNQIIDLEQNFLGIEKRRWVLSDGDNLPITKSKQGSLGINYDRPKIYIGLEGFYKQVTGISTTTQGFLNQNQFEGEIGKYDVKGVEFLINKKANTYSAWLSYTYNINNYIFDAIVPSSFPNNLDVRHTLTFAGTYTYDDFKISMGLNYHSGKPFTEPDTDNPIDTSFFPNRINFKSPNSSRLPEYLRIDASAIYKFDIGKTMKATIGASVLNISNRENILNTYFRVNDINEVEKVENISLGITPNFSFRVKF